MLRLLKKIKNRFEYKDNLYRYCEVEYGREANAAFYMLTHGSSISQVSNKYSSV